MPSALLLVVAWFAAFAGASWLALSMDAHWQQVNGAPPSARCARYLRMGSASAVLFSLACCLAADHATMAVLVWIMLLATSAHLVAFILSGRPRWLVYLIPFGFGRRHATIRQDGLPKAS